MSNPLIFLITGVSSGLGKAFAEGVRRFIAVGGDGTGFEIVNGLFPEAFHAKVRPTLGFYASWQDAIAPRGGHVGRIARGVEKFIDERFAFLRIAVRDLTSGRIGTLEVPLQ